MGSGNDNPLKRFSSFWLGLALFGAFGLASLVLGIGFTKPGEDDALGVLAHRRHLIARNRVSRAVAVDVDAE